MSPPDPTAPVRLGLAALGLVLFAGISTWVIRGEGASYRERLLIARGEVGTEPEPDPAPPPRRPAEPEPEAPASTDPEPKEVEPAPAPPAPAPPPSAVPPKPVAVADNSAPRPVVEAPKPPPAPAIDPFWTLPEQTRVWDLDHLTEADERRLGADLHRMILHHHKALDVGPLPKILEDAAEPILAHRARQGIEYTFTVLDCNESNVFSLPGGYVYVCRGLFDWVGEDEDYALAFLLAHEIAHVDQLHAIGCLRDPEVQKLKKPTVPLIYALILPFGYKPELDVEADQWAARRMNEAGRSRHETLAFLRKLEDYARLRGFENVRKVPGDDPKLDPLDNHLRAHPIPRKRIKDLIHLLGPVPKPG